jgi:hypothetical protein
MEPRKYSTGTKGRLKKHSDECREFIHANSPSFSLANEFIQSLDPEREDRAWQKFQSPAHILPELEAWLGGDTPPPVPLPDPEIKSAAQLESEGKLAAAPKSA